MQITVVNRQTGEQKVLSFEDFRTGFKTEFYRACQNYIRHETEKNAFMPEFMHKSITEADFLLNLAWNFNNYSGSLWYIAQIN